MPTKQILPPYVAPHSVIKQIVRMFYSSFVWLIILADGKIAFPAGSDKADEQRERLAEEGVVVKNYRVNMTKFGWKPDLHTILVELEY